MYWNIIDEQRYKRWLWLGRDKEIFYIFSIRFSERDWKSGSIKLEIKKEREKRKMDRNIGRVHTHTHTHR